MRSSRAKLVLATVTVIIAFLIWFFLTSRPSREEMNLRQSLTKFYLAESFSPGGATAAERATAQGAVSAEHIPLLLRWLQEPYRLSSTDRFAVWMMERFPSAVRRFQRDGKVLQPDPTTLAMLGFEFLGTNGVAALPYLRSLARTEYRRSAVDVMVHIGAASWEAGVELLHSEKAEKRSLGASSWARSRFIPIAL